MTPFLLPNLWRNYQWFIMICRVPNYRYRAYQTVTIQCLFREQLRQENTFLILNSINNLLIIMYIMYIFITEALSKVEKKLKSVQNIFWHLFDTFYYQNSIFRPAVANLTLFMTWPEIPYFFDTRGNLVIWIHILYLSRANYVYFNDCTYWLSSI